MKAKLILGSLLALSTMSYAQWVGTNPITTTAKVGIGTTSPSYPLDVQTSATSGQGIRIKQNGTVGEASLRMDAVSAGGTHWGIHSVGTWGGYASGSLLFRDESASGGPQNRMYIEGGTGNVGIGTVSTSEKLSISTAVANDGISVNQTSGGASAVHLYNASTGGNHWALFSTGNGNTQGSGNFSIFQYGNTDRLFINGSTGRVGIGTVSPLGKLHATEATNVAYSDAISIYGNSTSNSGYSQATGVYGYASGGYQSNGVTGVAYAGSSSIGGNFRAGGGAGYPYIGGENIGVYGGLTDDVSNFNVGVYGDANGFSGAWAGWFQGQVYSTGGYFPSDKRLKKDIKSMENSLTIINKLNPVTYNFDVDGHKNLGLPDVKQYGFISQEVQEILPELTKAAISPGKLDKDGKEITPSTEILTLNYNGFIAILTKGIQEQQKTIASQQQQLDEQKQLIDALTQKVSGTTGINSGNTVETGFQMSQNEPNPFTHETIVKYTLPQSISNAFMAVYDLSGKQITTFPINEKGASSLTITSEKLSAGIYIYSIVADGKVVDSKRMIVSGK